MTDTLRMILAGGVVLGVLVLLHEWGHFIVAKWCGVRVDVFSIGFGPRIWGLKRGDTDYRVSALPLGGYVRMAGDNPVEERTGAPYEFLSRPRWQRCLIALAGPTMNVLLTFLIFWGIYWFAGSPVEVYLNRPADVAAIPQDVAVLPSNVLPGDRILAINGVSTPTWERVFTQVDKTKPGATLAITVRREGSQKTLEAKVPEHASSTDSVVGYPNMPAVIDEVAIGLPAERAGMKADDRIEQINGQPVTSWMQLLDQVRNSEGRTIHFVVRRGTAEIPMDITPVRSMDAGGEMIWQVGIQEKAQDVYERQGFVQSFEDAGSATLSGIRQIGQVLGGLFDGKVSVRDLQTVVGIAREAGQAAQRGPMRLLELTAIISLNLGLLNLLPIPILDGGHILMLAIEGTLRRELSIAFKERLVQVGLVFLLAFFAFVMYNDILRVIQAHH
ncbi:MAG TPA: RIP metalloprotease RseP [Candidatus Acidoferrales bacterium]|nr:RIP metalloprotease RseP [Candidatus Acidoferrales bacterium]